MLKITEISAEPGTILRRYSSLESKVLAEKWLAAFDGGGARNTKAYMWHVFSFESHSNVSLRQARDQYEQQLAPSYIVLANDRQSAVEMDCRPIECSAADCYVFPPNLAWTMAFTHEDEWLGPYFSKHQEYQRLNQENLDRIRKAEEVERARRKGWL